MEIQSKGEFFKGAEYILLVKLFFSHKSVMPDGFVGLCDEKAREYWGVN